jgi:hypothetical protein
MAALHETEDLPMPKPISGLAWEQHIMDGLEYALNHLHPHEWEVTIPAKDGKPARCLQIMVSYSLHCFTRRPKDGEEIPDAAWYSDSRESRVFDVVRWELSKYLPDIITTLEQRRCLHTGREEFVTVEMLHEGRHFDYAVFFTVTKARKSGADLNLFVNSAHERVEAIKYKKPIRFHVILLNRHLGKPIKLPT